MRSTRLFIFLFLITAIVACKGADDPVEPTVTAVLPTATASATSTAPPHPTAPGSDLILAVTAVVGTATSTATPAPYTGETADVEPVVRRVMIDLPIRSYESTVLALPPCRVEGVPLTPSGIVLGTVPLPTPTPSPESSSDPTAGADVGVIQRYINTVYPSLDTALDWARAVGDVDIRSLDSGGVRSLIFMEASRLDAVCKAVGLISPAVQIEAFHSDFSGALLDRHSALGDVRDVTSSASFDAGQIISSLTQSLAALERVNGALEELAEASGLDYPPPLAGLVVDVPDLGIELMIPAGWQVTSVTGNLSLLAPLRMQGGGLQDVGSHFGAHGSEFVYSKLRNPSEFDENNALDRVERLLQSFGELKSETRVQVASLDGHVLDYVDHEQGQSTKVWVVSAHGFSNLFRVSCPTDRIDLCAGDVLPMISSATITE